MAWATWKPSFMSHDNLLNIAFRAVSAHLRGEPYNPPTMSPPWHKARPVFVTLRTRSGDLRGCIGHLAASQPSLAHEIAADAISAATKDPRFPPVTSDELASLQFSLSILERPEPVDDPSLQDPTEWGLVVISGARRGVLLPDLEGVDTATQQEEICRRKAGIPHDAPVQYERFRVTKVGE